MTTFEVTLAGCQPEPLAAYLKALGVLRLVAEQADPFAHGWWTAQGFTLRSRLDANGLAGFFLDEYCPTPVIAPWNGGSGFYAKDNQDGIAAIEASASSRFVGYKQAVAVGRELVQRMGLLASPKDDAKGQLLEALRGALGDDALAWLDAALVLTDDGPRFPPLLGTGGNDGRLDFTNNQMQRLAELLLASNTKAPGLLRAALYAETTAGLSRGSAIGQFHPAGAGGANATTGFDRDSVVNPWDYVLMLEGSLLFAAATTRRLEQSGSGEMAYPFMVRSTGAGYASASLADENASRDEIWLPLWQRPAGLVELRALLTEGRAKLGTRAVRTGVDFARAIAMLGVDRGIAEFSRFAFHQRNGLSFLATPLGRWPVQRNPRADLLAPLDDWLRRFRRAATDNHAPASLSRALRRLDGAILDLCRDTENPSSAAAVVEALGHSEKGMALANAFTSGAGLRPVPPLSPEWLKMIDDGSVEYRLASALASTGIRERLVPVRWSRPFSWLDHDDKRTVWGAGDLTRNLLAVLEREALDEEIGHTPIFRARWPTALGDLAALINGTVDEARLESLLRGLSVIDWREVPERTHAEGPSSPLPGALFGLLAVVHCRHLRPDLVLPRMPGMIARGAAGDSWNASRLAARRLAGAGIPPAAGALREIPRLTMRITAALAFPISRFDIEKLLAVYVRSPHLEGSSHDYNS